MRTRRRAGGAGDAHGGGGRGLLHGHRARVSRVGEQDSGRRRVPELGQDAAGRVACVRRRHRVRDDQRAGGAGHPDAGAQCVPQLRRRAHQPAALVPRAQPPGAGAGGRLRRPAVSALLRPRTHHRARTSAPATAAAATGRQRRVRYEGTHLSAIQYMHYCY